MKRYSHWIALALILLIVGVTWYRVEVQPPDPLQLFPSEQADLAKGRRMYVAFIVVAVVLAINEERRKRRKLAEQDSRPDGGE